MGIKAGIGLLDDEQVRSRGGGVPSQACRGKFPVAEPAGNLLGQVVADKAHVPLIDLIAGSLHDWLRDNQTRVVDVVERQAPGWSPKWRRPGRAEGLPGGGPISPKPCATTQDASTAHLDR